MAVNARTEKFQHLEANITEHGIRENIDIEVSLHRIQVFLISGEDEGVVRLSLNTQRHAEDFIPIFIAPRLRRLGIVRQMFFPNYISVQGVRTAVIAVKLRADANIVQIRLEMLRAVDFAMLHQISAKLPVAGHLRDHSILPDASNRLQHIVEIADAFTQQRTGKYLLLLFAHCVDLP